MTEEVQPAPEDLYWLYQLALSVGQSLNPHEVSLSFLKPLISWRKLAGASIWWLSHDKSRLELMAAFPEAGLPDALPLEHPLWARTRSQSLVQFSPCDPEFAQLGDERFEGDKCRIVHALGEQGVLLLRCSSDEPVCMHLFRHVNEVCKRLANAIEGGLSHQRLKQSESLLRATLEATDDGILVVTERGKVLGVNQRFQELWHMPDELFASKDEERWQAHAAALLKDPKAFTESIQTLSGSDETALDRISFKDGRVFERHTASLAEDIPHARVWSFRDVTTRETALTVARLERDLFAAGPVAVVVVNLLKPGYSIEYASDNVVNILGYGREALSVPDMNLHAIIHLDDRERFLRDIKRNCASMRRSWTTHYRVIWPDQSVHWLNDFMVCERDEHGVPCRLKCYLSDETGQRVAELKLAQLREQFQFAIEGSGVGLWDWDPKTQTVSLNRRMADLLGLPADSPLELTQSALHERCHPRDLSHSLQSLEAHMAGRTDRYVCEVRIKQANGEWRWMLDQGQVVAWDESTDAQGQVLRIPRRVVGTYTDISHQKKLEEDLSYERMLLRMLVNTIPDMVWLKNEHGAYLLCNPILERFLGAPASEIIGRTDFDFLDREQAEAFQNSDRLAREQGGNLKQEEQLQFADGSGGLFETTRTLMHADDGRFIGILGLRHDITSRKKQQARLDEALTFLHESQAIASLGGWKAFPDRDVVIWTPEVYRLIEHPIDEPIPGLEAILDYFAPDSRAQVQAALEETIATGKPFSMECHVISRTGRDFWAELRSSGRFVDPLHGTYLIGTFQDITEQREAAQALQSANIRWKFALDGSGLGVWDWNIAEAKVYLSPAWKAMIGYEDHEFANSFDLWVKALHPEDHSKVLVQLNRHLLGESPMYMVEFRLMNKQGEYQWVQARGLALERDETGKARRLVGVNVDINANRQVQERLSASEARLRHTLENSPHVAVQWFNIKGEVIFWNSASEHLYGWSSAEALGRTLDQLTMEKFDADALNESLVRMARTGERIGPLEYGTRHRNGEPVIIETTVFPIPGDTPHDHIFVSMSLDITERKRAEQALAQHQAHLEEAIVARTAELAAARDAAEAASRTKSTFLANMSHEIRTPMNAILGMAHLLGRSPLTQRQHAQLEKINDSAHHLLNIINDILDISKIEAGMLKLEQTDFDLPSIFSHVSTLIADRAEAKGLALHQYIDPAIPYQLWGDPLRLGQILINFVGNAVKFTDKGSVTMAVHRLTGEGHQLRLLFEVIDTGVGISLEQQARLFKSFEQADSSTTRRFGGTGLGLAISKRLIELMDGEVSVESELGKGSCFRFEVPLQEATQYLSGLQDPLVPMVEGALLPELALRERSGLRVLLAEDNEINQAVAGELLSDVGIMADLANNGREAVEKASQGLYDLILMDIQMPLMDGLDATRAIRALPGYAQVPILALTANAFEEDRKACEAAGMNDHVPKPVDPAHLYQALVKWLPPRELEAGKLFSLPSSQPQHSDSSLQTALEKIPGYNLRQGIHCLGGNLSALATLLRRFAQDHRHDMERLRTCFMTGRLEEAQRIAHSLKGTSATLGADEVCRQAEELERLLGHRADPAEVSLRSERLEETFADLSTRLLSVLPERSTVGGAPSGTHTFGVDAQELLDSGPSQTHQSHFQSALFRASSADLLELRLLLTANSPNCVELWHRLLPGLTSTISPEMLIRLDNQILNFDYQEALLSLEDVDF